MAYEIFAGTHPFHADNPGEVVQNILYAEPDMLAISDKLDVPDLPDDAPFLSMIVMRLLEKQPKQDRRHPRALVLAPTRELALQIHKDALLLGSHTGLKFGLAYGGVDYEKQRKTLEGGVDILIGTPGRLIDYFKQHVYNLKQIDVMVLDEADRMFDLGFIKDIR